MTRGGQAAALSSFVVMSRGQPARRAPISRRKISPEAHIALGVSHHPTGRKDNGHANAPREAALPQLADVIDGYHDLA